MTLKLGTLKKGNGLSLQVEFWAYGVAEHAIYGVCLSAYTVVLILTPNGIVPVIGIPTTRTPQFVQAAVWVPPTVSSIQKLILCASIRLTDEVSGACHQDEGSMLRRTFLLPRA